MGIAADKNCPGNALLCAIVHNGLGDRQDMRLIESAVECGTAMPRGAKGDLLVWVLRIRGAGVVGGDQFCDVNEVRWLCKRAGALVGHVVLLGVGVRIAIACLLPSDCAGRMIPRLGVWPNLLHFYSSLDLQNGLA